VSEKIDMVGNTGCAARERSNRKNDLLLLRCACSVLEMFAPSSESSDLIHIFVQASCCCIAVKDIGIIPGATDTAASRATFVSFPPGF
jgi:hypothetical protein